MRLLIGTEFDENKVTDNIKKISKIVFIFLILQNPAVFFPILIIYKLTSRFLLSKNIRFNFFESYGNKASLEETFYRKKADEMERNNDFYCALIYHRNLINMNPKDTFNYIYVMELAAYHINNLNIVKNTYFEACSKIKDKKERKKLTLMYKELWDNFQVSDFDAGEVKLIA